MRKGTGQTVCFLSSCSLICTVTGLQSLSCVLCCQVGSYLCVKHSLEWSLLLNLVDYQPNEHLLCSMFFKAPEVQRPEEPIAQPPTAKVPPYGQERIPAKGTDSPSFGICSHSSFSS